MKISASVKGIEKLKKKFDRLESDTKAGGVRAVQDSIFLIHKTAVEMIQDNSSGTPQIRYNASGRKRVVLASLPGDPPNTDTGRLVQSVKFDFKNNGLTGRVGTNLRYGAWLEFGTQVMAARPWLSAAVRETSKEVGQIFKRAIQDVIKGVTK